MYRRYVESCRNPSDYDSRWATRVRVAPGERRSGPAVGDGGVLQLRARVPRTRVELQLLGDRFSISSVFGRSGPRHQDQNALQAGRGSTFMGGPSSEEPRRSGAHAGRGSLCGPSSKEPQQCRWQAGKGSLCGPSSTEPQRYGVHAGRGSLCGPSSEEPQRKRTQPWGRHGPRATSPGSKLTPPPGLFTTSVAKHKARRGQALANSSRR